MTSPLYFTDEGTGDPLVLLHAFPLDGRMWAAQARELARTARVILPDFRGFGRSASLGAPTSLDDHADDIAALLDSLGIARATVVGLSMGGYIALAFVRRHGQKLARLGLADTRSLPDTPEAKKGRDDNIALVAQGGVGPLVEKMLPKLLSPNAPPDVVAHVRELGNSQTPEGITAALTALRDRSDTTPVLAGLGVPSAVIVGELDAITPPSDAKEMAGRLANCELGVVPGVGHLANLEAPAPFTEFVAKLLAR